MSGLWRSYRNPHQSGGLLQPPGDWWARYTYRQFASEIDGAGQLLSNLAANPSVRTSSAWVDTEIQCIVQDTDSTRLAELDTCITKTAALVPAMRMYPALRVLSGAGGLPVAPTADVWCQRSYWDLVVAKYQLLLSRRAYDDPRVGIDSEAYGGEELNRVNLAAHGKTLDDFNRACAPFVELLAYANPRAIPCIYAQVYGDYDHFNLLIERLLNVLGTDAVEVWWETAFGLPETYRLDKWNAYQSGLALCAHERNKYERNFQALYGQVRYPFRHRFSMDDDGVQYVWGKKFKDEVPLSYGPILPWVFDGTRSNKSSWGTTNGYNGVGLKSANDCDYVFAWLPTFTSTQQATQVSDGQATPVSTNNCQGTINTVSFNYSNALSPSSLGVVLSPPQAPNTWGGVRLEGVLPTVTTTPFTVDFSCGLPTSIAGDMPLISSYQYNQGAWQVYRKASDSKLYLQIKKTSSTFDEFALSANTFTPGASVRMQIGRSGNTWLYTEGSAAINRTDVGYSVTVTNLGLLSLGMGCEPAQFPLDNKQYSLPNLVLPSNRQPTGTRDDFQLHIWKSRLLSDSEITTQVRGNHWPFGRYT